jgi:hypothetical protein
VQIWHDNCYKEAWTSRWKWVADGLMPMDGLMRQQEVGQHLLPRG